MRICSTIFLDLTLKSSIYLCFFVLVNERRNLYYYCISIYLIVHSFAGTLPQTMTHPVHAKLIQNNKQLCHTDIVVKAPARDLSVNVTTTTTTDDG